MVSESSGRPSQKATHFTENPKCNMASKIINCRGTLAWVAALAVVYGARVARAEGTCKGCNPQFPFEGTRNNNACRDSDLVGTDNNCFVADFGLSRALKHGADGADYYRIRDGAPLPLRWSAPEVLASGDRFTSKSDV